jgi:hypothetical protein
VATREQRGTQNQELFRTANERLEDRVHEYGRDDIPIPFLCECADDACLGRVELTIVQYGAVRTHPNRFVTLPGPPRVEGEKIVEDNGHFHIVEKEG